jgi:hypothetical protein
VWRWSGKELAQTDDLRVFATTAGGSGAGTVNLSGMGQAVGLTPKGHLYTDRSA